MSAEQEWGERWSYRKPGSGPSVNESVLASGEEAVLSEYQRRQSFVSDLLANQRLEDGAFVEPRTRARPDQLHRIVGNHNTAFVVLVRVFVIVDAVAGRTQAVRVVSARLGKRELLVAAAARLPVVAEAEVGQPLRDVVQRGQRGLAGRRLVALAITAIHDDFTMRVRRRPAFGLARAIADRAHTILHHNCFAIVTVKFIGTIRVLIAFTVRAVGTDIVAMTRRRIAR